MRRSPPRKSPRRLAGLALATAALVSSVRAQGPETIGKLASPAITEASGLAASIRHRGAWWVINDSGSAPALHLAGPDGADLGSVRIRGVRNTDWEDLASFEWNGRPCVLVADTGDNASRRKSCALHIVREPAAGPDGRLLRGDVAAAWSIEFRYEDGPRDCESVAVDATTGSVLLLSKRTDPPVLYELPLAPEPRGIRTARRIAETRVPSPAGIFAPFGSQPTGMDISADGRSAVVSTYSGWFLRTRPAGATWADAFRGGPDWRGRHGLGQAEAIAFSRDGSRVVLTSEGGNPRLVRFNVRSEPAD